MAIKGITVVLLERTQSGTNALNQPVYTEKETEVENVLVAPASEQEITDTLTLYGRKAVYTLGLPKGDAHTWAGNRVQFFDRTWSVIGDVQEGIEDMIPLSWNKKIRVETVNEQ